MRLSPLGHTWILDLDGTVVKHNGYIEDGEDTLLPGAAEFLRQIPEGDMVLFLTSREEWSREETERFLRAQGIRYDGLICGAPLGERILVNDDKPSGLATSLALRCQRDQWEGVEICIDENL